MLKKQVTIPHDNYVNPKIKNINKITFRFTEFQLNRELDGGWKTFRDSISSKFDESWKTIAFDLRYIDAHDDLPYDTWETNYYKYWFRGNMAVEFNYNGHYRYPTLTFYNVPKYGANNIKVRVPTDDGNDDYLKYKEFDERNTRKID